MSGVGFPLRTSLPHFTLELKLQKSEFDKICKAIFLCFRCSDMTEWVGPVWWVLMFQGRSKINRGWGDQASGPPPPILPTSTRGTTTNRECGYFYAQIGFSSTAEYLY